MVIQKQIKCMAVNWGTRFQYLGVLMTCTKIKVFRWEIYILFSGKCNENMLKLAKRSRDPSCGEKMFTRNITAAIANCNMASSVGDKRILKSVMFFFRHYR